MNTTPQVTVSQRDRYTSTVYARTHEFTSDEPAEQGGADRGPSPWELLLAGMGSCTTITVQMYAERKGWVLSGVEVHLSQNNDGSIDMEVDIRGEGLDDSQRRRLEAIAQKCPVVKAVQHGIEVRKHVLVQA